jgi:hypothetical protein
MSSRTHRLEGLIDRIAAEPVSLALSAWDPSEAVRLIWERSED